MSVEQGRQIMGMNFKHVYEGGTHDVWCDGSYHAWTIGGKAEFRFCVHSVGVCDCHKYAQKDEKQ